LFDSAARIFFYHSLKFSFVNWVYVNSGKKAALNI
jgi:hypothetical protein